MIPKFEHCLSCGMPIMTKQDRGGKDSKNPWCKQCCHKDGTHKSYEQVVEAMVNFMLSQEGQEMSGEKYSTKQEAKKRAQHYLMMMPAWKKD